MLSQLKDKKKMVGTKQAKKAVVNGNAEIVFIAKDADTHIVNFLVDLCNKESVKIVYVNTMKELGKACGIDVGAASAVLLK
ncbi:ribosomal L7Ae/L30e/S12e/Gadd45 family protein [Dethiothermospora halolimnae]|uniref:ribosomal L7Ae/L30e/S12e/Gadd45 family protein n=1 Tax=Dethiothermospora halolimnae TaxID=3114390 RepID=UPI003CCBA76E